MTCAQDADMRAQGADTRAQGADTRAWGDDTPGSQVGRVFL
jgi:hypothetical protein